jgi:D-psicose/D-tagatose/L-ribulose 3-epimerase
VTKILPVIVVATFAVYVPSDTRLPKFDLHSPPSQSAVKVGYCTGLKNLEAAKAAGFDYVELSATEIAALTDDEFAAAAARIKALGMPTPAANLFLPATLKVTGPDVHPDEQMQHVHKAFTRLATLGTEIVVFGSGGARRVPDGFSQSDALSQLVDFGRRAARRCGSRKPTSSIRPRKDSTSSTRLAIRTSS